MKKKDEINLIFVVFLLLELHTEYLNKAVVIISIRKLL